MPPPFVPTKEVPRGFIPFVDEQVPESAAGVVVPGTPKFTPFRDEVGARFFVFSIYPVCNWLIMLRTLLVRGGFTCCRPAYRRFYHENQEV